jgi:predicted ATPase
MFELAGVAAADGLEPLMTATIGLAGGTSVPAREALLNVVRTWRALFIVDNCEHVLRGAAELVESLLAAAPETSVLATSRERLHLPGEQVVVLRPLPVDVGGPAIELFTDRSNALHDTDGTDLEIDAVARVCQRLDGMPLAIELAAARTVAMTPAEIERRLDQRFRLLTQTGATNERHGSLQAALDWSYDLLTPDSQRFFIRLSLFAGSFDAAAARAVAWPNDEFATLNMLDELVSKSLLTSERHGDRTSYRLLETMRQYGSRRLTPAEVEETQERHTEYFAAFAEAAWDGCRGRESQRWLDHLDDELDDVRVAFERAVVSGNADAAIGIVAGLFMYNQTRRLKEIFDWVDQAIVLPGASSHRLRHEATLHRAYGKYIRGAPAVAELEIQAVVDELDEDDPLRPMALIWLAAALGQTGRLAETETLTRTTLARLEQLGPAFDYDRAEALWNYCSGAFVTGAPDHERALELLSMARDLGNVRAIAGGLIQAGVADPDHVRGARLLAEAQELTARTRENLRNGLARIYLGALKSEADPAAGLTVIRDVVEHARRTGLELLLLIMPRSYFGAFSALGRHETIAVLDGSATRMPLHPGVAAAAIDGARDALGADRYDELKRQGSAMTVDGVAAYLLAAVADL